MALMGHYVPRADPYWTVHHIEAIAQDKAADFEPLNYHVIRRVKDSGRFYVVEHMVRRAGAEFVTHHDPCDARLEIGVCREAADIECPGYQKEVEEGDGGYRMTAETVDLDIDYSGIPEHMREGARAYIEDRRPPGGFLRSVLENNLKQAVMLADSENKGHIVGWVNFLLNEVPAIAWGSPGRVAAWLDGYGLKQDGDGPR